jgi:hypothetical protein
MRRFAWVLALAVAACSDPAPVEEAPIVTRVVEEPAGANCPDGGTAVQVGPDSDGNGALGDDEVTSTVYVCDHAVIRLVPEPVGENCEAGGTAIWTGNDDDGDLELDEDEVQDIAYLCNATHALLQRVVLDAPGAPCAEGAAVEVGYDLDDDGELADDEVIATEYVCDGALQGYVVIDSAEDVENYQRVRVITGDLIIQNGVEDVTLPELWFVGGSVTVLDADTLTAVHLDSLYNVGGSLAMSRNPILADLTLPILDSVGWGVTFVDDDALPAIDLSFVEISGRLIVRDCAQLESIELSYSFVGGGLEADNNPALTSLVLDSDYQTGSIWVTDDPALTTLQVRAYGVDGDVWFAELDALTSLQLHVGTVDGVLAIENNPALAAIHAFGILDHRGLYHVTGDVTLTASPVATLEVGYEGTHLHVDGAATISGTQLASIGPTQVTRIGGPLLLTANPALAWVNLGTEDSVTVYQNPVLDTVTFVYDDSDRNAHDIELIENPALEVAIVYGLSSVDGHVEVVDNDALDTLALDQLQSAGSMSITGNASLPTCQVANLFAHTNSSSEYQAGNDPTGTCN